MRIALFGGAFDPPHLGHVATITTLLNSGRVDQVWIVPVGDNRTDKTPHASAPARQKMVELMRVEHFGSDARVQISTLQLEDKLPGSYTIDLIDYLRKETPAHEFFFVIGADNLRQISKWKEAERLMREVQFLVMFRPGESVVAPAGLQVRVINESEAAQVNISSSNVRDMVRKGSTLGGAVPAQVIEFIDKNKLYR